MHKFKDHSFPGAGSSAITIKLMCSYNYCFGKAFRSLSPKTWLRAGICSVNVPRMAGKTQLATRITWERSMVNCRGHIYLLSRWGHWKVLTWSMTFGQITVSGCFTSCPLPYLNQVTNWDFSSKRNTNPKRQSSRKMFLHLARCIRWNLLKSLIPCSGELHTMFLTEPQAKSPPQHQLHWLSNLGVYGKMTGWRAKLSYS